MTERDVNGSLLPDTDSKFNPKNFKPELDEEVKGYQGDSDNSFEKVPDGLLIENLIDEIKAETDPIDAGEKIIPKEIPNEAVSVEGQNVRDNLENQIQKKDKINILGKIQRGLRDIREDYLPNTPKKVATLVAAALTSFQLGISSVKAETPAPADPNATHPAESGEANTEDDFPTDINGATLAPGNPAENGETENYPTEAYAERAAGIAECREFIKEHEYLPNLLDIGAEIMYTARVCVGFREKKYKYPERTKIGTYISDDDVLNWVKTGEGLSVVWYKDKDGNSMDKAAMIYKAVDSDYQISFELFQQALGELETDCPGFLNSLCEDNRVVVFLQTDAVGGPDGGSKFGWGEIYLGYNKATKSKSKQKERDIINLIKKDLIIEGFGNLAVILQGDEGEYTSASGVIKESLTIDWCKYMYKLTKNDFYSDLAKSSKKSLERYRSTVNCPVNVDSLMEKIKSENIIPPYGVDSWAKVDKVIGK